MSHFAVSGGVLVESIHSTVTANKIPCAIPFSVLCADCSADPTRTLTHSHMRVRRHEPIAEEPHSSDAPDVCCVFGGGGWNACFYLGVVEYLQSTYTKAELRRWAFTGESAGAVYALALCLGVPCQVFRQWISELVADSQQYSLGVVGRAKVLAEPMFQQLLYEWLPEDELVARLRGRFAVTFNAVVGGRPVAYIADDFNSAAEVKEAVTGSSAIPLITDASFLWRLPRVAGMPALDGGFTLAGCLPVLPSRCTCYCICCGEASSDHELRRWRLSCDIAPSGIVPLRSMFLTPSEEAVDRMVRDGHAQSASFFASSAWTARHKSPRATRRRHSRTKLVEGRDTAAHAGSRAATAHTEGAASERLLPILRVHLSSKVAVGVLTMAIVVLLATSAHSTHAAGAVTCIQ